MILAYIRTCKRDMLIFSICVENPNFIKGIVDFVFKFAAEAQLFVPKLSN